MIEQLFGSKTRVKLLQLFMSNPNRSFYVREITRKVNEQINSVRRELANLLSIGIITSDNTNNRLYYEVDQKYEYYQPLAAIFGKKRQAKAGKTEGKKQEMGQPASDDPLVEAFRSAGRLHGLVLTGQFTRDDQAGIDLLVIGNMNSSKLDKVISDLEASEGKEIRYVVFSTDEFLYRKQINDRFIGNMTAVKKQILYDEDNLI